MKYITCMLSASYGTRVFSLYSQSLSSCSVGPAYTMSIIQGYLFCGILFSLFSISMKTCEQKLLFSSINEELYSEVYHSLDHCFSILSYNMLLSGRLVQAKQC